MLHKFLYVNVHACNPSYTDEKLKTFQSIPKYLLKMTRCTKYWWYHM